MGLPEGRGAMAQECLIAESLGCVPAAASAPEPAAWSDAVYTPRAASGMVVLARADATEAIAFHINATGEVVCPTELARVLVESSAAGRVETLLDVGTNVGSCALLALRGGHEVVAVEPALENARLWRANVAANAAAFPPSARAVLLPYALSDVAGPAALREDPANTGNAMVVPRGVVGGLRDPAGGNGTAALARGVRAAAAPVCEVPADALLAAGAAPPLLRDLLARVSLVKIDVQGHELKALVGMRALLRAQRPRHLFVEVMPSVITRKGGDPAALLDELTGAGLRVGWTDGAALVPALWRERLDSWARVIADGHNPWVDLHAQPVAAVADTNVVAAAAA